VGGPGYDAGLVYRRKGMPSPDRARCDDEKLQTVKLHAPISGYLQPFKIIFTV
jgi:hypothetical protein